MNAKENGDEALQWIHSLQVLTASACNQTLVGGTRHLQNRLATARFS